jgi:hypothetical protein
MKVSTSIRISMAKTSMINIIVPKILKKSFDGNS